MSGPKRYLVDTNILLRFLTGTPPHQATAARNLFSRAKAGEVTLEITPIIVAEAFYTMLTFYGLERKEASEKLLHLLQQRGVKVRESDIILNALRHLQSTNVALADAYLATAAETEKIPVASFDKDFDKFPGMSRYEPVP